MYNITIYNIKFNIVPHYIAYRLQISILITEIFSQYKINMFEFIHKYFIKKNHKITFPISYKNKDILHFRMSHKNIRFYFL